MNKFLTFRGGLLIVAVAALVALGVAYLREMYFNRQMHGALWGLPVGRRHPRDTIRIFNVSSGIVHSYEDPRIEEAYAMLQRDLVFKERVAILREIGRIKYADTPRCRSYGFRQISWSIQTS